MLTDQDLKYQAAERAATVDPDHLYVVAVWNNLAGAWEPESERMPYQEAHRLMLLRARDERRVALGAPRRRTLLRFDGAVANTQ